MRALLKVRSLAMAMAKAVILANLVACGGTVTEDKRSEAEAPAVHIVPMNADSRPKPIQKEELSGTVPVALDDLAPANQTGSYFYDAGSHRQKVVYTVSGNHLQLDLFQNEKLYRKTSITMPTAQDFADSGVERLPYILYAKELKMTHRPDHVEYANEVRLEFEKPTPIFINNAALDQLPDDSFEFDMETEAAVSGAGYKMSGTSAVHGIPTTEMKRKVTVSYDGRTKRIRLDMDQSQSAPYSQAVYGYFIAAPWVYRSRTAS